MIERYYSYDTKDLLYELEDSRRTLKQLEQQYIELDGARAMDYSVERVRSSSPVDGLERIAIQRADLKAKIDRYRRDIELVDKCIAALPEDEQIVLAEFFLKKKTKQAAVISLCDRLALEQSAIYSLRRKALRDFERLLFG